MWKRWKSRLYQDTRLQAAATAVFALVWWAILYPELCFTEDTFQKIIVTEEKEETDGEADYRDIMEAAGDEIVIRSRLLEWLRERNGY